MSVAGLISESRNRHHNDVAVAMPVVGKQNFPRFDPCKVVKLESRHESRLEETQGAGGWNGGDMAVHSDWVQFHSTFATTHAIDAYGGFQFPRDALDRFAEAINRDGLPMSQHHDASQRVRVRNVRARVAPREDGEFELIGQGEIHPDDAHLISELGSVSMSVVVPLDEGRDVSESSAFTIAGNAAWFPDSALKEAGAAISQVVPDAQALRLYEFGFEPLPNIVVKVTKAAWTLLGGEVVWDGIKLVWSARRLLAGREPVPTRITLEIEDAERTAVAAVETVDMVVAERAWQTVDRAIDRLFDSPSDTPTVMWNEAEARWDDTSS